MGDEIALHLEINKGRVSKEELSAQMVVVEEAKEEATSYTVEIQYIDMSAETEDDTTIKYTARYKAGRSGKLNYGIRIATYHPDVDDTADLGLVYYG